MAAKRFVHEEGIVLKFEEWNHRLRQNCGNYYGERTKDRDNFAGHFRMCDRAGVDVAEIGCEIDRIERTLSGIRRDDVEHIFLLIQKSGTTKVTHNGREEFLSSGQCILLDSTMPAELRYDGEPAVFLSAHLPRGLCLGGHAPLVMGRKIDAFHPLCASFQSLLSPETSAPPSGYSPNFVCDLVGLAFGCAHAGADATRIQSRNDRYGFVLSVIDRSLTDPDLTLDRLAAQVHMSRRQLQREFSHHNTNFTSYLSSKRLKLVAEHLRQAARLQRVPAISELAYMAGFGDISHFNRAFRQRYGKSPRAYLREVERRLKVH